MNPLDFSRGENQIGHVASGEKVSAYGGMWESLVGPFPIVLIYPASMNGIDSVARYWTTRHSGMVMIAPHSSQR